MDATRSASLPGTGGWLVATLVAAALATLPIGARAEESCLDCHEDVAVAAASAHAELACSDCHAGFDEDLHPEEMTADETLCGECHDAGETLAESVHADVAGCQDCHGAAHELLPLSDPASLASPLRQVATCGECHDHDLIDGYLLSVHAHALLKSGLIGAPDCTACHGSHDILPASDPLSSISPRQVPETCGTCHRFILDEWRDSSAHGVAWTEGNDWAPVCVTCHASHEVLRPTSRAQRLASAENCGDCHGGRHSTYRDSFHGEATDLGFERGATCSDCHTPHRNLAAADPRSSVHPDALAATCGQCHGEVSAGFLTFDPHSDPSDPERSRPLYLVWLFMTTLLLSVFGFFGVHDLLWLQRALAGWRRGEFKALRDHGDGPWIRRFSKAQILTHATVIVSFLILAATGLPLKYHYAAWAQWLTATPGTVAVFRLVHRLAAVATFGYAVFHVGYILRRAFVQREPGLFWGWKSLVPNPRDFADLWNNLRYFLYLEPRLRTDRWTYWEKFDYFAVFWGVPIIGGSGLMLWFPDFFTRFLPGWVLNAAFVIHSDEALLATGFIFVFHFFHTHLRPESFPMDPVIFVGSMPLARFREERPLEYQRLADAGEIDSRLVDPPTAAQLRRAHFFGLTAVFFGVLLAIAIFGSILLA